MSTLIQALAEEHLQRRNQFTAVKVKLLVWCMYAHYACVVYTFIYTYTCTYIHIYIYLLSDKNAQGAAGEEFISVEVQQIVDLLPDTQTRSLYLSC